MRPSEEGLIHSNSQITVLENQPRRNRPASIASSNSSKGHHEPHFGSAEIVRDLIVGYEAIHC